MFHNWDDKLVAAGKFTSAGGQPAHNIAVWDGAQWSALGDGWDSVYGIATHSGQLHAAGRRPGCPDAEIAKWDGTAWTTVVKSARHDLVSFDGKLYQGKAQQTFGGHYACQLWEYNGTNWTEVRSWTSDEIWGACKVDVLTLIDGELYLHVSPYSYVYSFDGTDFTPYAQTGLDYGQDLVRTPGGFYAVGWSFVGEAVVNRWNGTRWEIVFYEPPCYGIDTAVAFNDKLIVAGEMKSCASMPGSSVLSWDGSNWSAVGGDMNDCVWALAVYQGRLIAGGRFTEADGMPISFIAEYIGTPTPVTIGKFRAHASPGGVDLAWQITADEPFGGFSIYRSDDGGAERALNTAVLPADTRAYTDQTAAPGGRYSYVLVATGGESGEIRSQRVAITMPLRGPTLHQNIPNPFNPETTVRFTVATQGRVTISVYTSDGRLVRSLVDASYAPGEWSASWDGTDDKGQRVASGVYYYRMRSGKADMAKKMVLLK